MNRAGMNCRDELQVVFCGKNNYNYFKTGQGGMPVKRSLVVLMLLTLCWGCTKEQGPQSGQSASPDGSLPLPVVNFAEIVSPTPTSENPLALQFATISGESRPELFIFKWYVDGTVVDGVSVNALEPNNFRKGSKVEAEVIPTDGKRLGAPFRAKALIIKNALPVVTSASLRPVPAFAGDTISVITEATDRDGDTISSEIQWLVNSANVAGSEQGHLNTAGLKKKDRISAMVTPFDGEERGTPYPTNYLALSNQNPEITSTPSSALQNGTFIYQVTANDPDRDPVTFSLVAAPPGMAIDKSSGLIKWDPPAVQSKQQITVKIAADDGDGGVAYQEFSINLDMR